MFGIKFHHVFAVLSMVVAAFFYTAPVKASVIVQVSIPVGSSDAPSHSFNTGIWSVTASGGTLPITTGIGYLVNPTVYSLGNSSDFGLHDHVYVSPNHPDPSRAIVTYKFDSPTVVSGVEIIQHTNGISQIEGFYGNSLGSMNSLGSVFGPYGDITASLAFPEGETQVFDFGNTTLAGTYFQFIVRKTPLFDGWAAYRALPLDAQGNRIPTTATEAVPEPTSLSVLMGMGAFGLVASVLRHRRQSMTAA